MTRSRIIAGLIGLYALLGVVTFGHAAAAYNAQARAEYAACDSSHSVCIQDRMASLSGMTAAILWPFYWSWEAWS